MKKYIGLIFLTLALMSCKKWQHQYPEDTERTKLTPMERLINKTWVLQKTTINGIDISDTVRSRIGEYSMVFSERKENGLGTYVYLGGVTTTIEGDILTVWKFSKDESDVGWSRFHTSTPGIDSYVRLYIEELESNSLYNGRSEILKLTENEFKSKITDLDGDTVLINTFTTK